MNENLRKYYLFCSSISKIQHLVGTVNDAEVSALLTRREYMKMLKVRFGKIVANSELIGGAEEEGKLGIANDAVGAVSESDHFATNDFSLDEYLI